MSEMGSCTHRNDYEEIVVWYEITLMSASLYMETGFTAMLDKNTYIPHIRDMN